MLILAGVSLNAIIGDNGIITNAQEANMKNGMAALEEFLQQKYVENYEKFNNDESKVYQLQTLYPSYFYIPSAEGVGGLRYIVDSKGHALYLIKKSGLPKEIKEQLIGGNAGAGTYTDYATLNDVYGVTADLKVYYSEGTGATLFGLTEDDLDNDNPQREVFNNTGSTSSMYDLLSRLGYDQDGDGKISAEETKAVDTLTIGSTSSVTSLSDLYNLTSLESLTISNKNLLSLDGIQNCTKLYYLYLDSSTIGDYSALVGNTKKLQYLYVYNINDSELSTLCDGIKAGEFSQLHYVKIVGNTSYISSEFINADKTMKTDKSTKTITSLEPLNRLNTITKKAIQYLALSNNKIGNGTTGTKDLSYLSGYTSLIVLRLDNNEITSLNGISNMNVLTHLYARNNLIGKDYTEDGSSALTDSISSLESKKSLTYLDLENNSNLKAVDYLLGTSLNNLWLAGCSKSMNVNNISSVILKCGTNYSLPCKFLTGTKYVWSDYYYVKNAVEGKELLTADALKSDLENNSTITTLKLSECKTASKIEDETEITNQVLNDILKTMPQLKYLSIDSTYLETLDFCELITEDEDGNTLDELNQYAYCPNLIELNISFTYVTDISPLNNVIKKTFTSPNGRKMGRLTISKSKALDENGKNIVLNLEDIQDVIENLTGSAYFSNYTYMNVFVYDQATLDALGKCTNVKLLKVGCSGDVSDWDISKIVNFTGMSSLKEFHLYSCKTRISLPKTCPTIDIKDSCLPKFQSGGSYTNILLDVGNRRTIGDSEWKELLKDFSSAISIKTLELQGILEFGSDETFYELIDGQSKLIWDGSNCGKLNLRGSYNWGQYGYLDKYDGMKNLTGLKKLSIANFTNNSYTTSFWSNLTGLTNLAIENCKLSSFNGIEKLTNLVTLNLAKNQLLNVNGISKLTKLVLLNLSTNKISSLAELKSLTNLGKNYVNDDGNTTSGYLNLENNQIYDTSSYIDDSGNTITYNNLKILAELNPDAGKNGNLKRLYLSGNSNLIDKTILTQYSDTVTLSWTEKTGF